MKGHLEGPVFGQQYKYIVPLLLKVPLPDGKGNILRLPFSSNVVIEKKQKIYMVPINQPARGLASLASTLGGAPYEPEICPGDNDYDLHVPSNAIDKKDSDTPDA